MSQADNVRMMRMEQDTKDLKESLAETRKDVANLWAKLNELRAEMKQRKVA